MATYNVLMITEDYVQVEANSAREAEMVALKLYQEGEIRPQYPMFTCEEADREEEIK